jgi:hypothetical protein
MSTPEPSPTAVAAPTPSPDAAPSPTAARISSGLPFGHHRAGAGGAGGMGALVAIDRAGYLGQAFVSIVAAPVLVLRVLIARLIAAWASRTLAHNLFGWALVLFLVLPLGLALRL